MTSEPTASEVPVQDDQGATTLTGHLGVAGIVFMVIAAAAPLTVIGGNVPIAIGNGPGAGAPVGFIIAAIVLLLFSVGFVTMTPHVKEAGAFFSYIAKGLGGRCGLGAAFVALLAYTAIQVGIYGYIGWAVDDLAKFYGGPVLPWWAWALAVWAVVGILGYRHIDLSAKVLGVALALEITVVVVMDIAIFAQGGASGISMTSFTPAAVTSGPLGIAVLFAITGFIGFEATAVFRDEARDPQRTIPRATYLAVLIIGVFYAVSCWAIVEAWGPQNVTAVAQTSLSNGTSMMLDTAAKYAGAIVRDVMQILLVSSLFACVLSFHNVIARYQFTLANKGILPRRLGRVHDKQKSPHVSSLLQTGTALVFIVVFAVAGLDPLVGVFGSMAGVATVGMVMLLLLTSIAVPVFFRRHPLARRGRVATTFVFPALAVVGLSVSMWLVLSNFTLVTGLSFAVSTALAVIPAVGFIAGLLLPQSRKLASTESDEGGDGGPHSEPAARSC
jgi:amino acid transporter